MNGLVQICSGDYFIECFLTCEEEIQPSQKHHASSRGGWALCLPACGSVAPTPGYRDPEMPTHTWPSQRRHPRTATALLGGVTIGNRGLQGDPRGYNRR